MLIYIIYHKILLACLLISERKKILSSAHTECFHFIIYLITQENIFFLPLNDVD
jgi:hypothetical protein